MLYYIDQIKQAVKIEDVMAMYGLDHSTRKNVRCPSIEHEDKNASARIYTDNNICKCFSCNRVYNPINLVMEREGFSQRDFPKACELLLDRFGLDKHEFGEGLDDEYHNVTDDGNAFPFNYGELKLLCLEKSMVHKELKDSLGRKIDMPTIKDLWDKDSEFYDVELLYELIKGKCEEKKIAWNEHIAICKDFLSHFEWDKDFEFNHKLYELHLKYENTGRKWTEYVPEGMNEEEYIDRISNMMWYEEGKNDLKDALSKLEKIEQIEKKNEMTVKKNIPLGDGMKTYGKKDLDFPNKPNNIKKQIME